MVILLAHANPDGQELMSSWYMRRPEPSKRVIDQLPRLYQKYIGHDNNRDSYMMNVVESRVIQKTWREWEPNIIYVQHQSSPEPTRIWIPPFADPSAVTVPWNVFAICGKSMIPFCPPLSNTALPLINTPVELAAC